MNELKLFETKLEELLYHEEGIRKGYSKTSYHARVIKEEELYKVERTEALEGKYSFQTWAEYAPAVLGYAQRTLDQQIENLDYLEMISDENLRNCANFEDLKEGTTRKLRGEVLRGNVDPQVHRSAIQRLRDNNIKITGKTFTEAIQKEKEGINKTPISASKSFKVAMETIELSPIKPELESDLRFAEWASATVRLLVRMYNTLEPREFQNVSSYQNSLSCIEEEVERIKNLLSEKENTVEGEVCR